MGNLHQILQRVTLSLLLFVVPPTFLQAQSYLSVANGVWQDANTWSCTGQNGQEIPPTTIDSFGIIINHRVTLQEGNLILESGGIIQNENLIINDGNVVMTGGTWRIEQSVLRLNFGRLNLGGTAIMRINESNIELQDGSLFMEKEGQLLSSVSLIELISGNLIMGEHSTLILNNGPLRIIEGSSVVQGLLNFAGVCTWLQDGSFWVLNEGNVTGLGNLFLADGSIFNFGDFSESVSWCANGGVTGISQEEDCETVRDNCDPSYNPNDEGPLPIRWHSFNVQSTTDGPLIQWSTAEDFGIEQFVVERHQDDGWLSITNIPVQIAHKGTKHYEFRDNTIKFFPGIYHYRVGAREFNGKTLYTGIKSAEVEDKETTKQLYIYPNPGKIDNITIAVDPKLLDQDFNLHIYNIEGKLVWQVKNTEELLSQMPQLGSDVYLLYFKSAEVELTYKFIITE